MAKKSSKICAILATGLVLAGGVAVALNRQTCEDYLRGLAYSPSTELSELEASLQLTSVGTRIFRASDPQLMGATSFNSACPTVSLDTATLGCYDGTSLHVYNVDSAELAGIRESTFAHELLHAVWARLSESEQSTLAAEITTVAAAHTDQFALVTSDYAEADQNDEYFARIGTQISPDELDELGADHLLSAYARIFTDPAAIVAYYVAYRAPFEAYTSELAAIQDELDALELTIYDENTAYAADGAALTSDISAFNTCSTTPGCFTSNSEFYAQRSALVSRQAALSELYSSLSSHIETYNSLIAEYNEVAAANNALNQLINSRQAKEAVAEPADSSPATTQ